MANIEIPGLTFMIRQSLDRDKYQAQVYNQEFIERLKLVFGHPDYVTLPSYGIVTDSDPTNALPGTNDSLAVTTNSTLELSVDINPGMAVTKSGVWIRLNEHIRQIDLADSSLNIPNVLFLQYVVTSASPEVNAYSQPVPPFTVRPGGLLPADTATTISNPSIQVVVDTVDAYLQLSPEITEDYIPLAVITVQNVIDPITGFTTTSLDIDHTRNSYDFNRPWFSPQDIEHRSRIGSGVASDSNPHAISGNEISNGKFSPLQLQLDHGMIVGDDVSIPKQPGYRCHASIPFSSILTDDASGTFTGFPNKMYIELPGYPTRVGRVWDEQTLEELAVLHVEETNRIVFSSDDPPNTTVSVYYTKVDACEPPIGTNEVSFTTKQPTENELVIAGGLALTNISTTSEGFADAQKFPMLYDMLVDEDGSLFKAPQVIYCYKSLASIVSSDDFEISMYGPGKLAMGLAEASGALGMSLKVRVYGKDTSGTNIDYLFEFDSNWSNPGPIPNEVVNSKAFQISDSPTTGPVVFASVDELTIEEATDLGLNASIMVWNLINPYDTYDKLKDACHVAELIWDGLRITNMRDKRIIDTKALDIVTNTMGQGALTQMMHAFGGGNYTVYAENFRSPKYHAQVLNTDEGDTLFDAITASNISKLRTGHAVTYTSRALPVNTGSGMTWRLALYPLDSTRLPNLQSGAIQPRIHFYTGSWTFASMTPVPGMPNMYEATSPAVPPTRIKLEVLCNEHTSMVVFG